MSAGHCDCVCLGCEHFCSSSGSPAEGQAAHHTRPLLALDRSVAAACRSRGVAACNGLDDNAPCEVGTLHSRTADLAVRMADAIENSGPGFNRDVFDRAHDALEALLLEVGRVVGGKARAS